MKTLLLATMFLAGGPKSASQLQLCLIQAQELCEDAWKPYVTTECHDDGCRRLAPKLEFVCFEAATDACLDPAVQKMKLWKRP